MKRLFQNLVALLLTTVLFTAAFQVIFVFQRMKEHSEENFMQSFSNQADGLSLGLNYLSQCVFILVILLVFKTMQKLCSKMTKARHKEGTEGQQQIAP